MFKAYNFKCLICTIEDAFNVVSLGDNVDQTELVVAEDDFVQALDVLVPSVSQMELEYYKSLQYTLVNQK